VIAERCLGVVAEAWDVGLQAGVPDARLHFPDGRTAAFEVTVLAAEGVLQTENLLAADNHVWPAPGLWVWTIEVGSPRDLPRLRQLRANHPRLRSGRHVVSQPDCLGS